MSIPQKASGHKKAFWLNGRVDATVERLPEDKVRLSVEVSRHDLEHAVEHATSDLAESVKIPGFRKGKVPTQVLVARVGKERVMDEAISSHIGGWFRNAATSARIHPIAQPDYEYELPESAEDPFTFTATVAVQPKVERARLDVARGAASRCRGARRSWSTRRSRRCGTRSPSCRRSRAVLPEMGTSSSWTSSARRARRAATWSSSSVRGRMVDELEDALTGMSPGETKDVEHELADGSTARLTVTLNEIKEKVLPPADDDLARAASEFDTLAELRGDIEERLRDQISAEIESGFRAAAADTLVQASGVQPSGRWSTRARTSCSPAFLRTLESRGISPETYLMASNQTPDQLRDQLRAEAALSVARELVLDAVAEQLGIEVSDEEIEACCESRASRTRPWPR